MFTESLYPSCFKAGRNGSKVAVITNEAENNLAERLDEDRFRQNLHITLKSLVARSTTSKKRALLAEPLVRDVLFQSDPLFEFLVPDNQNLLNSGHKRRTLEFARQNALSDLKQALRPIYNGNSRSEKSYKCELAALIITSYGRVTSIPKNVWSRLQKIFGLEILNHPETSAYKEQMTVTSAKNWFRHLDELNQFFNMANIEKEEVLNLAA